MTFRAGTEFICGQSTIWVEQGNVSETQSLTSNQPQATMPAKTWASGEGEREGAEGVGESEGSHRQRPSSLGEKKNKTCQTESQTHPYPKYTQDSWPHPRQHVL